MVLKRLKSFVGIPNNVNSQATSKKFQKSKSFVTLPSNAQSQSNSKKIQKSVSFSSLPTVVIESTDNERHGMTRVNSWLCDDDYREITVGALNVVRHARINGYDDMLDDALEDPLQAKEGLKKALVDYINSNGSLGINEVRSNESCGGVDEETQKQSLRGLERVLCQDYKSKVSHIERMKIEAILKKQKKLRAKRVAPNKISEELGRISREYSGIFEEIGQILGEVDHDVNKELHKTSAYCDYDDNELNEDGPIEI